MRPINGHYQGGYPGYVGFLKGQKEKGVELTLVKTRTQLYCLFKRPDGSTKRWHYRHDANAEEIAREVGIKLLIVNKTVGP